MKRGAALAAGLLVALTARAQVPAAGTAPAVAPADPSWLERWGWNARERTARGIARLAEDDAEGAAAALDVAHRLAPGDATGAFNAGTGRLAAGRPDAVGALEQAARDADAGLAPDAYYNLGNARLAGRDARGAVAAYTETLRRAPERADAKHNLELALRELQRQEQERQRQQQQQRERQREQQQDQRQDQDQQEQQDQQDRQEQREPGEDSQQQQSGADDPSQPPPQERPPDDGSESQPSAGDESRDGRQPQQRPGEGGDRTRPDPKFRDVPEMNAEQAAALLQAVENLERQARRERAAARAAERAEVDDDW